MTEEEKSGLDDGAAAPESDEKIVETPASDDVKGSSGKPEKDMDPEAGSGSGEVADKGEEKETDTDRSGDRSEDAADTPSETKDVEKPKENEPAVPDRGSGKDIEESAAPPADERSKDEFVIMDPLEDFRMGNRVDTVQALVKKHAELIEKYTSELGEMDVKPPELLEAKETEKVRRDAINEVVQKLKSKRKELKDSNKALRAEFFDLLEKEEKLREHRKDVDMYSQFSRDLEWKLETEAIDIDIERRLLDELRETMDKMRSLSDGYTPEEIKTRLTEIQEQMGENLMQIEEHHRQMLEKVEESNVHHNKLVDVQRQLKEKESRKGWLKRRIELHQEMEKFWSGQIDQSKKLDDEESKRSIENIRDQLLEVFKERDDKKEEDKGPEPADKAASNDRKRDRPRRSKGRDKGQGKEVVKEEKPASGNTNVEGGPEASPAESGGKGDEIDTPKEDPATKEAEAQQGATSAEQGGEP
ncbi:MAG: hypothetical protein ACMUHB_03770 [Thermoplasmatota archaeon]